MHAESLRDARRALIFASLLATLWAAAVEAWGGFVVDFGFLRFSSRNPIQPATIALVLAAAAGALLFVPASRTSTREDLAWLVSKLWLRRLRRPLHPSRVLLASLVAILSLADVVQWLRAAPLWVDEEMIAINIRDRPFIELTGTLWLGQSAPLGWLIVERAVLLALGSGELALRTVPLMFGIATLCAAGWIGWRWMTAGVAASFVLAVWVSEWLSHFRFELKHYSADAFWALLLPALAAWVVDRHQQPHWRRWIIWWSTAALAQLFSNGGLLVTPGCAIVLAAVIVRRHGVRAVVPFVAAGAIWLAAFVPHYLLSLQFTHHNRYLRNYWVTEVPPDTLSLAGTLNWIGDRLGPLAENPAASTFGPALWVAAAAGLLLSRHRVLSLLFVTAPLSAFGLAAFRFVPLYERFSLWIVPALYVGVALLGDEGWRAARRAWSSRRVVRMLSGVVAMGVAVLMAGDIFRTGWPALDFDAPRDSNHGVDDRQAVPWLIARRQPGDAVLSTKLGWPAIWWYGTIPLAQVGARGRLRDGSVMYQLSHHRPGPACADWASLVSTHRRILVYVAFPDMPDGFYELVLKEMLPLATVVDARRFADRSQVAVLERRSHPGAMEMPPTADPVAALDGCVGIGTARRW